MTRLRWTKDRGGCMALEAARGAMRASVYLRRDGQWGWDVGRCRTPQSEPVGLVFVRSPWTRGASRTRRDAQRQCLRWVRTWHRGARVWPKGEP